MEGLKTPKDVVKFCEERDVEMIHLWFVDILGQLKSVAITLRELGTALEEGVVAGLEGHLREAGLGEPSPDGRAQVGFEAAAGPERGGAFA